MSEPLVDMVRLLASLTDADGRVRSRMCYTALPALTHFASQVRIPAFLDDVRRLGQAESDLFDAVVERCKE